MSSLVDAPLPTVLTGASLMPVTETVAVISSLNDRPSVTETATVRDASAPYDSGRRRSWRT